MKRLSRKAPNPLAWRANSVALRVGDVAVRAFLHRIGVALSVDVAILLMNAASVGTSMNAHLRQFAAERAAAKRGLALMRADATRLQRKLVEYEAEVADWQARAEVALRAGNVPLARQALARKLQVQRVARQYADQHTAQQQSIEQVHAAVMQLEAGIRNVRLACRKA